jgi:1-deoxy-D-xylulose-5-phosphate reductoisomerase
MQAITLLGSTGSIGTQTLDLVGPVSRRFQVVGLTSYSNVALLAEQVRRFRPQMVAIGREELLPELRSLLTGIRPLPEVVAGTEGLCQVAAHPAAQRVVTGIVGCAGLLPTLAAIRAGKDIALANKETLVAGGPVVLPLVRQYGVNLIPRRLESIRPFSQCLQGVPAGSLRRILLTASGGRLSDWPAEKLDQVTLAGCPQHPNWVMGRKITIDSATHNEQGPGG